MPEATFDVVIVGSGFGGSVMAHRLSAAGLRVCVLERGKAYAPGAFPRTPIGMRDNFWDPSQGLHGLFDVWSFKSLEAIVASGLGGGSLIYSNVLERKEADWFFSYLPNGRREAWPISRAELDPHYDRVEQVLCPTPYPIQVEPYSSTGKTRAFAEAAARTGGELVALRLAIRFGNDPNAPRPSEPILDPHNLHGANNRATCRLCGECNLGCNDGSKNSLDFNYLSRAWQQGADIRTNTEVRRIVRTEAGFEVFYRRHQPPDVSARRPGSGVERAPEDPEPLRARRVVLAAGTLGSPYLLLRNADSLGLKGNPHLGKRFCANGDFLAFVFNARDARGPRSLDASHAPVITTAIRFRDGAALNGHGQGRGMYLEDAGQPEWIDWIAEATDVRGLSWRALKFAAERAYRKLTGKADTHLGTELHRLIGDAHRSSSSMPLLAMGLDTPDGVMTLSERDDRMLEVDWEDEHSEPHYERARKAAKALAKALGGKYAEVPFARTFNREMTVHPLGGCPMGKTRDTGLVSSESGMVFDVPGLYVADGSVMPGPVGTNPSLTIAAVADRFADAFLRDA